MDKGTLNAAFSCLEGIYTNQNVGKHVSALLQASRGSASHFLPPYPLFPPLAPPLPATDDCAKKAHPPQQQQQLQQPQQPQQQQHQQHSRVPSSGTSAKSERKAKRDPGASASDGWVQGQEKFSWDGSPVAAYNPATKMFRCVACNTLGFLSRIAEHYLGTHVNAKVFQCPECPYSSAWSRCVRLHLGKVHGIQNVPASLWRDQPLLDEIMGLLQNLKNLAESSGGAGLAAAPATPAVDKRYVCPRCPYATDRRDLYHRHENIHKDDKPFHCYVCFKLFNRADHVKKHFLRIHKNHPYDIGLIRRHPPRSATHTGHGPSASGHHHSNNGQWTHPAGAARLPQPSNCAGPADCSRALPVPTNGCPAGGAQAWGFHAGNVPAVCSSTGPKAMGCPAALPQETTAKGKRGGSGKAAATATSGTAAAKTFACAYCPWRGVDGWCLRRHLNTHIKPFSCPFCEYKAARSERLNTHVLKVHGKHLCNKCHFAGEDSIALERHVKENHLSSSLNDKSRMGCSLYPPFPVRPPHPPISQPVDKCKIEPCGCSVPNGTSACTSNSKPQVGPTEQRGLADCVSPGPARGREGGCRDDPNSLATVFPYRCVVCGFCSFTQDTMIAHMRLHSGQTLRCRAMDACCQYSTPFEDVLRKHVSTEHADDDAVARCPHCGMPCSSAKVLTRHAAESHHNLALKVRCADCAVMLLRHFGLVAEADTAVRVLAAPVLQVQRLKQSRKQPKPRKVVVCCSDGCGKSQLGSAAPRRRRKLRAPSRLPLGKSSLSLSCHHCKLEGGLRRKKAFRCHSSYLVHMYWCHLRERHRCSRCGLGFRHGYQCYLHSKKQHS
ncbi:uncharacterized protein [Dermacentor andersoni]|uniref:uncharacterized protein isoform X2 n=1 Tax=Dermacentor andersoni TaxID=34620 RepID=UPI003B3B0B9D